MIGVMIGYSIIWRIRRERDYHASHKDDLMKEINTLEIEKANIAGYLHGDLGPKLFALKTKITSIQLEDKKEISKIKKTSARIDDILTEIGEISFDLMPSSLLVRGFVIALKEYLTYLNRTGGVKFIYQIDEIPPLAEAKAINIFRIAQESIFNSIKNCKATSFTLQLINEKENIILMITETGKAFNTKKPPEAVASSLKEIKSRCDLMDAQMRVESIREKGTTYEYQIPV